MKKFILLLFNLLVFTLAGVQAQSLTVDSGQSNIRWYGEELTGKTHFGNLKFKSAAIEVKDGIVSSGSFIVDMTSLTVKTSQEVVKPDWKDT